MKKLLVLVALFTTVYATNAQAQQQGGGDPAAMMQRMKDRIKPLLIEQTKLTDAQADKVIEINFSQSRQRREIRMDQNLSDDDKAKKTAELDADREKQFKAIPLTDDQVKSVNTFFEEMRKRQGQNRPAGNGNQ